jgi:hypothetical protein
MRSEGHLDCIGCGSPCIASERLGVVCDRIAAESNPPRVESNRQSSRSILDRIERGADCIASDPVSIGSGRDRGECAGD